MARATRLMLTHLPGTADPQARKAEAEPYFDGPILLASADLAYDLA